MKFDDSINGVIAMALGGALVAMSRSFPDVRGIEYGPGLFPTVVGAALILAGLTLVLRRVLAPLHKPVTPQEFSSAKTQDYPAENRGIAALYLQIVAVLFYVFSVNYLGFLIAMPILLFCLLWWYDRRVPRAIVIAVVASVVLHSFFYQLMSVPLPWGLLEPIAGKLTW